MNSAGKQGMIYVGLVIAGLLVGYFAGQSGKTDLQTKVSALTGEVEEAKKGADGAVAAAKKAGEDALASAKKSGEEKSKFLNLDDI